MEYTQNFYRNYNIKNSSMVNKIWVKEKRAVTVLEVRSCEFLLHTVTALFFRLLLLHYYFYVGEGEEFPLRTGAISLFSSTAFTNACIVYVGRAGRRISSAHDNRFVTILQVVSTVMRTKEIKTVYPYQQILALYLMPLSSLMHIAFFAADHTNKPYASTRIGS